MPGHKPEVAVCAATAVPPRSAFVASYLDHLVSQGAPEAKIKLVRAAIIERSLARRGEDYPFRIRRLTYH